MCVCIQYTTKTMDTNYALISHRNVHIINNTTQIVTFILFHNYLSFIN